MRRTDETNQKQVEDNRFKSKKKNYMSKTDLVAQGFNTSTCLLILITRKQVESSLVYIVKFQESYSYFGGGGCFNNKTKGKTCLRGLPQPLRQQFIRR